MAGLLTNVEVWVLRNGYLRTVSGWEHSSTKRNCPCAVRVPGGVGRKVSHRRVLLRENVRFLFFHQKNNPGRNAYGLYIMSKEL